MAHIIITVVVIFVIAGCVLEWRIRRSDRKELQINLKNRDAAYDLAQIVLRTDIEHAISDSKNAADEVKRKIFEADQALSRAELEFAEGAFAPFWDAVELAATRLAQSNSGIEFIIQKSKVYLERIAQIDSTPPSFPFGAGTFPDTMRTTDRMRAVVRNAQKNFHFATIYEQRKTNKLLIAGFTNLAEALNTLGERLEFSLWQLSHSLAEIGLKMEENWAAQRKYEESNLEQAERELAMLDNIQRGKRPSGEYPVRFE